MRIPGPPTFPSPAGHILYWRLNEWLDASAAILSDYEDRTLKVEP